jgi:hypothetical protein
LRNSEDGSSGSRTFQRPSRRGGPHPISSSRRHSVFQVQTHSTPPHAPSSAAAASPSSATAAPSSSTAAAPPSSAAAAPHAAPRRGPSSRRRAHLAAPPPPHTQRPVEGRRRAADGHVLLRRLCSAPSVANSTPFAASRRHSRLLRPGRWLLAAAPLLRPAGVFSP